MKKSNKILLGGFLTLLLIFTAIHIALYAKYESGDYTIYNAEDDLARLAMQQFPNILFVSVSNVPGATVKFDDVAQVEKEKKDDIQYTRKGDTLQITGDANQEQMSRPVTIHVPANSTLSLHNSSLVFESSKRAVQPNATIHLQNSRAIFAAEGSPLVLGNVRVTASERSLVLFRENARVANLDVRLLNSSIEATEADIAQLAIVTDSASRVSLSGKQLFKANIRSATSE